MLADDDPTVLVMVRRGCDDCGFEVTSALDVPQTLHRLDRTPAPDAIVLDISLGPPPSTPGLPQDGLDLLKWIRRRFDVPVVMLSAVQAEEVKILAYFPCVVVLLLLLLLHLLLVVHILTNLNRWELPLKDI